MSYCFMFRSQWHIHVNSEWSHCCPHSVCDFANENVFNLKKNMILKLVWMESMAKVHNADQNFGLFMSHENKECEFELTFSLKQNHHILLFGYILLRFSE